MGAGARLPRVAPGMAEGGEGSEEAEGERGGAGAGAGMGSEAEMGSGVGAGVWRRCSGRGSTTTRGPGVQFEPPLRADFWRC